MPACTGQGIPAREEQHGYRPTSAYVLWPGSCLETSTQSGTGRGGLWACRSLFGFPSSQSLRDGGGGGEPGALCGWFESRVGFAHEYRPLADDELCFVLQRRWRKLGHDLDREDFTDAQAIAAIARVTRGNFRLVDRLFTQMERVMKINELNTITDDVVEAARSTLVIGIT